MFKKIVSLIFFSLFFSSVVLAGPNIGIEEGSVAQDVAKKSGYVTEGITDTTLSETVGRYIYLALTFIGIVFFLLTLYAGYLWMFGGGNEENIGKARKILSSSVIGLVIVFTSYGTTALILHYVVKTTAPTPAEDVYTDRQTYVGCCITTKPVKYVTPSDKGKVKCFDSATKAKCKSEGGKYTGDRTDCSQFSNCGSVGSWAGEPLW